MSAELNKLDLEIEEVTNDLLEIIWPLLDAGVPKNEIEGAVQNVMDAWEPLKEERKPNETKNE